MRKYINFLIIFPLFILILFKLYSQPQAPV